jgi:hypothetical protein
MVLAGKTLSLAGDRQAAGECATMGALHMVTQHCAVIFLIFDIHLIFQKIVENSKMHRK